MAVYIDGCIFTDVLTAQPQSNQRWQRPGVVEDPRTIRGGRRRRKEASFFLHLFGGSNEYALDFAMWAWSADDSATTKSAAISARGGGWPMYDPSAAADVLGGDEFEMMEVGIWFDINVIVIFIMVFRNVPI